MLATIVLLQLRRSVADNGGSPGPTDTPALARGAPAPTFTGTTLDGEAFDLAALRGRPVILNFWGPSCVPCRDEFPLLLQKLGEHASDDLAVIGVLTFDPPAPAKTFITQYGATWPTVDDPDGAIRTKYRVVARPQSYFIDRDGILRSIQVGELTACEFERQLAAIAGPPGTTAMPSPSSCVNPDGGEPTPSVEIPPLP